MSDEEREAAYPALPESIREPWRQERRSFAEGAIYGLESLAYPEAIALESAHYAAFGAFESLDPYGEYPGYDKGGEAASFSAQPVSRPLRVVCAGPAFQIGGVEQHTRSLARFLDPRRVRIDKALVTRPKRGETSIPGIPFPIVHCTAEQLRREAAECDVLLLWGEGFNDRLPADRAVSVFLAHGESTWTRACLDQSRKVVDHVIAVSDRVRRRVCGGYPTTSILNGVDCSRLAQSRSREAVRASLGLDPTDFVLGSVGRMTSEKRMDLLIDAVATLPRKYKLLLVGYGPRRAELLERANDRIPGRYVFVTADDYLGDYYRAMDAFALVSAHEGFGLVIAEAMFCGRPVIATDVGCVPEVIQDRISGLVVGSSVDSIAAATRRLAQHPAWAAGVAAEGEAFAHAHLHARRMAREYEDLLIRLVAERGRPGGV